MVDIQSATTQNRREKKKPQQQNIMAAQQPYWAAIKIKSGLYDCSLATFLRPVFAASRVQQVSDLHLSIRTKATPCVEVWQTSNLQRLRLGEEKKTERRRTNKRQDENIMICPIP